MDVKWFEMRIEHIVYSLHIVKRGGRCVWLKFSHIHFAKMYVVYEFWQVRKWKYVLAAQEVQSGASTALLQTQFVQLFGHVREIAAQATNIACGSQAYSNFPSKGGNEPRL